MRHDERWYAKLARDLGHDGFVTLAEVLPATFRLIAWDTPQRRDGRTKGRWVSTGSAAHRVVAEGITRAEIVAHIEGAADWLAWDGKL